mgnify:CR=1 FL=1
MSPFPGTRLTVLALPERFHRAELRSRKKRPNQIRIPYFHSASDMLAALITIAFVFFPRQISVLFFHEEEVIRLSVDYLRIIGFSEIFLSVEMMTVGACLVLDGHSYAV